jgi:thiamine kinase-like enzyme
MIRTHPSSPSAYDRYRPQLTVLVEGTPILKAIEFVGIHRSWWKPGRSWTQTFARFDPDRSPFVTLLYETTDFPQEICTVGVFRERPSPSKEETVPLGSDPEMWIRTVRFPNDPKLPDLQHVLADPVGHPTVMRYRPGKRCTLRFDAHDPKNSCFAKVFRDNQGARIHEESQALWEAACNEQVGFSVAQPITWNAHTHTLWQHIVQGQPIVEQLGEKNGVILAERLGRAAASITQSGLQPQTIFDGKTQMERSSRYVEDFRKRIPALSDSLEHLLANLADIHETYSTQTLFPLHGAPHAHQWLDTGTRLGLVDFDRFSLGDREIDAATFLTELEFEGHTRPHVEQIKEAFLTAYESVSGPLRPSLLSAYRTHKCLAKAYKASRSVRPDGAQKAARYLQKAVHTS